MNATITSLPKTRTKSTPKTATKSKKRSMPKTKQINRVLTHTMGWGMPLLSIALAQVAGVLFLVGNYSLMSFAAIPMIAVLAVSLEHLAWSVRDITQSPKAGSWALAIAFDLAVILGEICYVTMPNLRVVGMGLMVCLGVLSGALNVHAFFFQGKRK